MSNVQQMNLIGFYYHGYVSLHIISRQSFQINLIKTILYGPYRLLAIIQGLYFREGQGQSVRDRTKCWRIFRELCAQAKAPFLTVRIRTIVKFFRNSDFLLFILKLLILISGTIKIQKIYQI